MTVEQQVFKEKVNDELMRIGRMLVEKNEAYGDAAMNPVRIFSDQSAEAGLLVRIDDKLSRIKSVGINDETEDSISDLIGYLILLQIKLNEKRVDDCFNHTGIQW